MIRNTPSAKTETELFERYAGNAFEKQVLFNKLIGQYNWNVDTKKREITFGTQFRFPVQIIGTFSQSGGTWLWAWANTQSALPDAITKHARELKKYGDDNGIEFLSKGEFPFAKDKLQFIALIASGAFACSGYYLGNYGAGTMVATITSPDAESQAKYDGTEIIETTLVLISNFSFNHHELLKHYLKAKGFDIEVADNHITGATEKIKINADFDSSGRLTGIKYNFI